MRNFWPSTFCPLLIVLLFGCKGFDEQLMLNKANRLHDQGKLQEAIAIYNRLLVMDPDNKVHPDNALVAYELGMAYLDAGNRQKALEQVNLLRRLKRADLAQILDEAMKRQDL